MLCASEYKNSCSLFFCILLNYSAKKLSGAYRKALCNANCSHPKPLWIRTTLYVTKLICWCHINGYPELFSKMLTCLELNEVIEVP